MAESAAGFARRNGWDREYATLAEGTTIGDRKVDRFPAVTVWKLRLTIVEAQGYPAIRTFAAYRTR